MRPKQLYRTLLVALLRVDAPFDGGDAGLGVLVVGHVGILIQVPLTVPVGRDSAGKPL